MSSSFVVEQVSEVAVCFGIRRVVAVKTLRACSSVSEGTQRIDTKVPICP